MQWNARKFFRAATLGGVAVAQALAADGLRAQTATVSPDPVASVSQPLAARGAGQTQSQPLAARGSGQTQSQPLAARGSGQTQSQPPAAPGTAQTLSSIPGFAVTYRAPAGWTLSGTQGRMHAWSTPDKSAALILYAGHFSSLELALGDAQRVLGVPRDEDTQILVPLGATRFGSNAGLAGSLRVKQPSPVLAHVAVAQLNDSTVIGAVIVLDGNMPDSALNRLTRNVSEVLTGAAGAKATADPSLHTRMAGHWEVQVVHTAGASGGGYTNEESWTFSPDGAYAYRKRFSVSLPGAAVTPEERDESGRWYAVGGAVVLVSDEGRITVDVEFRDSKLILDGTAFSKR